MTNNQSCCFSKDWHDNLEQLKRGLGSICHSANSRTLILCTQSNIALKNQKQLTALVMGMSTRQDRITSAHFAWFRFGDMEVYREHFFKSSTKMVQGDEVLTDWERRKSLRTLWAVVYCSTGWPPDNLNTELEVALISIGPMNT